MKMTPTTLDRKARKKWLKCPALAIVLALLLVLSSLPVYAGEQQTEQTETPTVTQDAGSESAQSATSSEQNEPLADELEPVQPIDPQEPEVAATEDWTETKPHEGQVLHGGYVGFRNVASGKYLTAPNGVTVITTNIIQYDEVETPNAQEFLLEYTYSPISNEAYFRIFSVTANGTKSNPVKSVGSTAATANVRIDSINYLFITDRWQIEHVYGNYYYIYLAHNPGNTGTKYALTANGTGNGISDGTSITSQGNVYVSPLSPLNGFQMWEICADGEPMDIHGQRMTTLTSFILEPNDEKSFFYVPQSFNETLMWVSSNPYVAEFEQDGILTASGLGSAMITLTARTAENDNTFYSSISVILPNGLYRLTSNANGMWMDLHYDKVTEDTPVQIYDNTNSALDNPSMIFKIHHLGMGLYSIRSMRRNDMGISLSVDNQTVVLKNIGNSHTSVLNQGKWYFSTNEHGMYIYSAIGGTAQTITVPLNAVSSDDLIIDTYEANNVRQVWHIEPVSSTVAGAQSKIYVDNDLGDITVGNTYSFDVWFTHSSDEINGNIVPSCNVVSEGNVICLDGDSSIFDVIDIGTAEIDVSVPNEYNLDPVSTSVTVLYPTPSNGDWFIENASSGNYASTNGQTMLGSSIVQASFNDHAVMEWEFEHVSQSYFRIKSKATGLYLTAPSSVIGPVIQETSPDDNSLWKIERTTGNRYRIISKTYEASNCALAIASSTIGNLYLYGYTDDANYNDEWYLNISGDELTILAMAEEDRSRGGHATEAAGIADSFNVSSNVIIQDKISKESVISGMETSQVFISRSHGSPTCIQINDDSLGYDSMFLEVCHIYDYSSNIALVDLSGCELVMFIGCSTAADDNEESITHAAVDAGAACAIGFGDSIHVPHADEWMKAFLESFYINSHDVYQAKADALIVQSGGNMDTGIIVD